MLRRQEESIISIRASPAVQTVLFKFSQTKELQKTNIAVTIMKAYRNPLSKQENPKYGTYWPLSMPPPVSISNQY